MNLATVLIPPIKRSRQTAKKPKTPKFSKVQTGFRVRFYPLPFIFASSLRAAIGSALPGSPLVFEILKFELSTKLLSSLTFSRQAKEKVQNDFLSILVNQSGERKREKKLLWRIRYIFDTFYSQLRIDYFIRFSSISRQPKGAKQSKTFNHIR